MPAYTCPAVKPVTPTEHFESIGNKVNGLAEAIQSDVTPGDGCQRNAVEEIESLCMNCGKNVTDIPVLH
jgi:zinc finger protein